jgi:nitrous oxide reductase accessory protein NosL
VTVLGCTLFSHISDEQRSTVSLFVSDFSNIADWSVDKHNAAHLADLAWLNAEVDAIARQEPQRSAVVLTHYSPTATPEANDPEHAQDPRGVQSAFVTDLQEEPCWMSPVVKVWAFGHTHYNFEFVDRKTGKLVVANQRGYGREDIFNFDAGKTVIV